MKIFIHEILSILQIALDSKRSASSDFTLRKRKKQPDTVIFSEMEAEQIILTPSSPLKVLDCGGGLDWFIVPLQNHILGHNCGLFRLENRLGPL
jgi:hypothetical protein